MKRWKWYEILFVVGIVAWAAAVAEQLYLYEVVMAPPAVVN